MDICSILWPLYGYVVATTIDFELFNRSVVFHVLTILHCVAEVEINDTKFI
jgi:hypothetical protein